MPTVLEATNSTAPENLAGRPTVKRDGQSLAAAFRDASYNGHTTLFFHHNKGRAMRHEGWKLVSQSSSGKKSKGKIRWELYNLNDDPLELNDLAATMPQKVTQLKTLWKSESDRLEAQAANR